MKIAVLLLLCLTLIKTDAISNGTVDHRFLTRSSPRFIKPTNLGTFPFQCVTDLTECDDGFTLTLTVKVDKGNPRLRHQYLISSGGQLAMSNGFYLRRKYGKGYEAGVGYLDKEWMLPFWLVKGRISNVALTWHPAHGLQVYVDGIIVGTDSGKSRLFTNSGFDQFMALTVGSPNNDWKSRYAAVQVCNLIHWDEAYTDNTLLQVIAPPTAPYLKGCVTNLPQKLSQVTLDEEKRSKATACRSLCSKRKLSSSILKGTACACASANTLTLINPCPKNSWKVYSSGLPEKPPPEKIGLNVSFYRTTPDGVVEPNETVIVHFSTKSRDMVVFYIDFGDGTKKITAAGSISHAYLKVGTYKVNVTAVGYEVRETQFVTVKVEAVERGIAPQIVELQAAEGTSSLTADIYVIAAGMGPISCNLDFGEGNPVAYSDLQEYVNVMNVTHTYSLPGFYDVKLSCSNEHGTTEDKLTIVSRNHELEAETLPVSLDVQFPIRGANMHDIKVLLDNKAINAHINKSGVVITPDMFPATGRHVVSVMSGSNFTINKRVVNIQAPVSALRIEASTLHAIPSQNILLNFSVTHGDHLFTRINYGDGRQEFVYKQHPKGIFHLQRSLNYKHYGLYKVEFEVANDISYEITELIISIERHLKVAKMKGMNVTRQQDPTIFTFTVDPGVSEALPLDVEMKYGNGITDTIRMDPDPSDPHVRTHQYVYPNYGIYTVSAKIFNNISFIHRSTLVQVGQNITMVDAWTDRERIAAREEANIYIHCPFGSPVTYTIDFGDGVTMDKTFMNLVSDIPEGVTPEPPNDELIPHLRRRRDVNNDTFDDTIRQPENTTNVDSVPHTNDTLTSTERTTSVRDTTPVASTTVPTPTIPQTSMAPKIPSNLVKVFNHRYKQPGAYNVSIVVKNTFGNKKTWICPSITVTDPAIQSRCDDIKVTALNKSTLAAPLVAVRSDNITLRAKASLPCGKRYVPRFSWKTQRGSYRWSWRPELNFCERNVRDPYIVIPHRTLWYGFYKITVTVGANYKEEKSRRKRETEDDNTLDKDGVPIEEQTTITAEPVDEIVGTTSSTDAIGEKQEPAREEHIIDTTSATVSSHSAVYFLKVNPSPLVAHIKGEEKRDLAKWERLSIDMGKSHDPDVMPRNRTGLKFHLVCFTEEEENKYKAMSSDALIKESKKIGQNADDETMLYDAGGCFHRTSHLFVSETQVSFTAGDLTMNDTVVFRLIVRKDERVATAEQKIKVWSTNMTGDLLDNIDALLASGDTGAALMVIGDIAGDLDSTSVNDSDSDAKAGRTELRTKLLNALEGCSQQIQDFGQLSKTTDMLVMVTGAKDETTPDAKKTAASALKNSAGVAKDFQEAPKSKLTDMATGFLGTAGNVMPFQEKAKPEEKPKKPKAEISDEDGSGEAEDEDSGAEIDVPKPEMGGVEEEKEPEPEPEPLCCDRYGDFCAWIEPDSEDVDPGDQKFYMWDHNECEEVHPDDLAIMVERFNAWKAEQKRQADDVKKETTGSALGALDGVGDVLLGKAGDGESIDISTGSDMKLAFTKVDNSGKGGSFGAFKVPAGLLGNNMGVKQLDSPNPFTYGDTADAVKGGTKSMSVSNPDGTPKEVTNLTDPIEMWLDNTDQPMEFRNFTLHLKNEEPWNFHKVNVSLNSSVIILTLIPTVSSDKMNIYLNKIPLFPNSTHHIYKGVLPRDLEPGEPENDQYTLMFPANITDTNGTYVIGVELKETTVDMLGGALPVNVSYKSSTFTTACVWWDEKSSKWKGDGAVVGPKTSFQKTQCLTTHLTSFGGDFVVPPNTIDFNTVWAKFNNLNENAAVFSTIVSLLGLYVIFLFWCRRMDKKDVHKWCAQPLEDNLPTDNYHYQITVQTAVRKNAGTKSKVSFVMSGDSTDTGVRRMDDGKRTEFKTGSILNFILSTEDCLGQLTYLRIWHDNCGKGKKRGWYLDQVQVIDLQTGDRFFFLCDQWLDVIEGDGMVERILPVAGMNDLSAFKHLFSSSVRKKLTNEHLWFSVMSRPTRSNFTRVQRVSCCVSLLFLTMIANCMFFKADDNAEKVSAVSIGPFQFTLHQLYISVMSTLIVFPPNLILVTIFRKARPKKNTVMQSNMKMTTKRHKWKTINAETGMWPNMQQGKSRAQKLKESVQGILSFHKKDKYKEEAYSMDHLEKPKKKKKGWSLPHWSIYIAWTLCFFSVVTSAFFTILYSMEWGNQKSIDWLTTFVLSFFQSVIVVQPIKVLLLAAFISCIMRKPEFDEEDDDYDDADTADYQKTNELLAKDKNIQEMLMKRQMAASEIKPPDTSSLEAARDLRMKEMQMEAILKEVIVYFFFLIVLFFLSYQNRDTDSFPFAQNIKNTFFGSFSVTTPPTFWKWMHLYFLPSFFSTTWYNGKRLDWREKLQIEDRQTIRVGVARLRQLRIRNDSCDVITSPANLSTVIHHCREDYNWVDDDTDDYYPGWVVPPAANYSDLEDLENPWVYKNSLKLKSAPYPGMVTVYKGGGYVFSFKRNYPATKRLMQRLEQKEWVDVRTRGLMVEFTLYNANVNLFASVVMLVEFMGTGSAITKSEVKVFRLSSYVGGFGVIVIIFELTYLGFTLFFLIKEINRLRKEKMKYFKDFWSLLEFVTLALSVTTIAMYAMKKVFGTVAMNTLHESGSGDYVNFVTISIWDETYNFILGLVVFISTIKFIKLLKFNKRMSMLGDTILLATKDLKIFTITFLIYFSGFCQMAYVLFGHLLPSYGTFIGTIESLFAFALGSFDFYEFQDANRVLGPFFFFMYVAVVYIGLMGMFLTIIYDAFAQVKSNSELQSNDYEIVDFMMKKFKGVFGWS